MTMQTIQDQTYTAELSNRVISFTAPNKYQALKRAMFYQKDIKVKKLYLHEGTCKRAVWDPVNDFGVVQRPPKNWKWFWKLLFKSWVLSPLIPIILVLEWMGLTKISNGFNQLSSRYSS